MANIQNYVPVFTVMVERHDPEKIVFDEAKNRHFWPLARGRNRKNRTVLVSMASATMPKRADFGLVKKFEYADPLSRSKRVFLNRSFS